MQYTNADSKTYQAAGALAAFLRVKKDGSGKLIVATATDKDLGVTTRPAFAADEDIPVRLRTAQGTTMMTAIGNIGAGVEVFAAADGKVAATGTVSVGTNESGAVVAGDYLEVLRNN